jgi:LmbE family N-acetylglucosaminyl deacetylase
MKRVLVISPHLDDAVLSAGQFLAGRPDVVVATIFAGTPRTRDVTTTYDAKCGFKSAVEAMTTRRGEDQTAMALLGATPVHLGFVDSQYGKPTQVEGIAHELGRLVHEYDPEFVVGPLGLVHPDHELVRDALLDVTTEATTPVWLYEDLPSRVTRPEAVEDALAVVANRKDMQHYPKLGFCGTGDLSKKMVALWCYRSQLSLFENHHELLVSERFWEVKR